MSTTVATERAAPVERGRLNVLFITPWYPTKEHIYYGVFVRELAKAVQEHHKVVVLHLRGADRTIRSWWNTEEELDESLSDGIRTYRALFSPFRIRYCSWPLFWASVISAAASLRKRHGPFDLVHAHVFSSGPAALLIGRRFGVPVVISEHNTAFARGALSRSSIRTARWVFRKVDAVLPVSNSLQGAIQRHGINARFQVVPNAINTNLFRFEPSLRLTSDATIRLLTVISLVPRKGLFILFRALQQVHWGERSWHLDIVGTGPDEAKSRTLADELGLAANVTFQGSLRKSEIVDLMRKARLFVLPSLAETFSVATAEALAAGLPAVVTKSGGPEEFVDERCGVVVKPGDPSDLARGLTAMLDNLDKYDGKVIARIAAERFSYRAVGAALDNVYSQVTGSIPTRSGSTLRHNPHS